MDSFIEIQIITKNDIEGEGFLHFFQNQKPENKISLTITPSNIDISNLKIQNPESNKIVIIDTDHYENHNLFDFLNKMQEIKVKCIIYSGLSTPGLMLKARQMMVEGYISKTSSSGSLIKCLSVIELGGFYYDHRFSTIIKDISKFENSLSLMQRNIFYECLLFKNRTISNISEALNISRHSTEVHLSNIYLKAQVKNYTELISRFSL